MQLGLWPARRSCGCLFPQPTRQVCSWVLPPLRWAMAGTWLLLLLALGCPALPTEVTTLLRLAQQGVGSTPFPSLAPPITLLVDGKQQTLVICLVLDVAPPGLESPIWFSAGNGSSLDAFTYGPSPAADGTWTSLAQLSLPSEELAAWETLVCHTGPGTGDHSQSTQPLQLSGEASSARTCLWEPLRGTRGQELRLGALRLLLFKLLLLDVLLTCSRLRFPPAARGDPVRAPRPGDPRLLPPSAAPRADRLLPHPPPPGGSNTTPTDQIRRSDGGTAGGGLSLSARQALQPPDGRAVHARHPGRDPRSPVWEQGPLVLRACCSGPALSIPASRLGALLCDLPPPADPSFPGGEARSPPQTEGFLREKALSLPSDWKPLEHGNRPRHWDV
ncbi:pre T-cell antigen receptor alpha [Hippopotamus amphibius kiboko]|uniref:pre T-cell antigen receptor alpha n=1 Tax=Hippopotamus amphibius kiboko TaxID=575201 RepID=UPI002598D38C|nr:pre T-cell antigen receptor alpha [Hippopotamus amphibius kiboko]